MARTLTEERAQGATGSEEASKFSNSAYRLEKMQRALNEIAIQQAKIDALKEQMKEPQQIINDTYAWLQENLDLSKEGFKFSVKLLGMTPEKRGKILDDIRETLEAGKPGATIDWIEKAAGAPEPEREIVKAEPIHPAEPLEPMMTHASDSAGQIADAMQSEPVALNL